MAKRKPKKILKKTKILRKAPRRKILKRGLGIKNPNLTDIKKGEKVYVGKTPVIVDKVTLQGIIVNGNLIPFQRVSKSPVFKLSTGEKYINPKLPMFRKVYVYKTTLKDGNKLFVFVHTFLNGYNEVIDHRSWDYDVDLMTPFNNAVPKLHLHPPDNIKFETDHEALRAALVDFKNQTDIYVPLFGIPLIKHGVEPLYPEDLK